MQASTALFDALRQAASPDAVLVLETLVRDGRDEDLARINAIRFAGEIGLDPDAVIAALLHASQLGLFEMSWNVLCPSCSGVLDANATLKSVRHEDYRCAFCELDSEPVLDDTVEVVFTVSPRIRRIAAHDPDLLGFWDYQRQVFFGSGFMFPPDESFRTLAGRALLDSVELQAGDRMILSIELGQAPVLVFDAVTHTANLLLTEGEPTRERQDLTLVFNAPNAVTRTTLRPGPLRLALDNRSAKRVLPGVFQIGPDMEALLSGRRPFLAAKRLLCNQTFRDLFRTDTLAVDQRLKIINLTFLFTDLKDSTDLYEHVGDLVAYDLVRAHFRMLHDIVASEGGAVVKTIGDAVMATFPAPHQAVAAALRMRESMRALKLERGASALGLKIGIHAGPCLAVSLNDRQDYFGQTVNIASRVQNLAGSDAILATDAIATHADAASLLASKRIQANPIPHSLRGIGDRVPVFELI